MHCYDPGGACALAKEKDKYSGLLRAL